MTQYFLDFVECFLEIDKNNCTYWLRWRFGIFNSSITRRQMVALLVPMCILYETDLFSFDCGWAFVSSLRTIIFISYALSEGTHRRYRPEIFAIRGRFRLCL